MKRKMAGLKEWNEEKSWRNEIFFVLSPLRQTGNLFLCAEQAAIRVGMSLIIPVSLKPIIRLCVYMYNVLPLLQMVPTMVTVKTKANPKNFLSPFLFLCFYFGTNTGKGLLYTLYCVVSLSKRTLMFKTYFCRLRFFVHLSPSTRFAKCLTFLIPHPVWHFLSHWPLTISRYDYYRCAFFLLVLTFFYIHCFRIYTCSPLLVLLCNNFV